MILRFKSRLPVEIHPLFWVFSFLIGYMYSQTWIGTLVWVCIIFVSVLFHEMGHALTAIFFGQKTKIQLVILGGLTSYTGSKLNFWKQFLIVLNGPLFGILLVLVATALLQFPLEGLIFSYVRMFQLANLFWSFANLLPILPLDGGQLLRIALEGFFGVKGLKASFLIGAVFGFLLGVFFFLGQNFIFGALLFLFAYQSFDLWRQSRLMNSLDREEAFSLHLLQAQKEFHLGNKEEAEKLFRKVLEEAKGGVLSIEASCFLADLLAGKGNKEEAFILLLPIKHGLQGESLCLLQELGFERRDYSLVAEISSSCYQFAQNQEVALRNARAFAALGEENSAGGWIQTAWQHDPFDLATLLQEPIFQHVREKPSFKAFIDVL